MEDAVGEPVDCDILFPILAGTCYSENAISLQNFCIYLSIFDVYLLCFFLGLFSYSCSIKWFHIIFFSNLCVVFETKEKSGSWTLGLSRPWWRGVQRNVDFNAFVSFIRKIYFVDTRCAA